MIFCASEQRSGVATLIKKFDSGWLNCMPWGLRVLDPLNFEFPNATKQTFATLASTAGFDDFTAFDLEGERHSNYCTGEVSNRTATAKAGLVSSLPLKPLFFRKKIADYGVHDLIYFRWDSPRKD